MKIAVIGVGGVGGYFGAKLAQKQDVTFMSRGKTFDSMKKDGLRVEIPNGDIYLNPVNVSKDYTNVGIVDLVLICVKSHQLIDILHKMKPIIGEQTIILPLLNGLDAVNMLKEVYGEKVIGGLCKILSYKISPNTIHCDISKPSIDIGEISGPISGRIKRVQEMFISSDINTVIHDDFLKAQWEKMILICVTSGIGAITRSSFGEYRKIPEVMDMVQKSIAEEISLAKSCGANVSENYGDQILQMINFLPEHGSTSMQRDLYENKPSEIDYLLGTLVKISNKNNVDVPLTKFIYYSLLPQEFKARSNVNM